MTQQAPALPSAFGAVLTSEQLYRLEVARLPRLNRAQEQTLVARAKAGEDVRNEIVLSLQTRICTLATRYSRYRYGNGTPVDWLDLCQAANSVILETFAQALIKRELYPYLLGVARMAMIACLSGRDDLIKTHHHRESIPVLSLDRPPHDDGPLLADLLHSDDVSLPTEEPQRTDYRPLYQAIAALSEAHRIVIKRHYGLDCPPETLDAISADLGKPTARRPSLAHSRKRQALIAMREQLVGMYA